MMRIEKLCCGYSGLPVLRNVSFTAKENEKLFIVGPNGCGKTTMLRAMAGLISFDGNISIDGLNIKRADKKSLAKKIAIMSQFSAIYFPFTVYETVMQGRYAHMQKGLFKNETPKDREAVMRCLESTDLIGIKDKSIKELSGGQLQRTFLARVFAQEPQVILLDEPTNHLDIKYQLELMEYLEIWVKAPGRAVIGVLHDINLAMSFCDRLLVIREGRIFAHGKTDTLDFNIIDEAYGADVKDYMIQSLRKWDKNNA